MQPLEGNREAGRTHWLGEVIERVGFEGLQRIFIISRHKDYLWRRSDFSEQGQEGKSRAARHLHIQEDHIRLKSLNHIDGRHCAVGLAYDLDAWMRGEAFSQVHARALLIIHQHSAYRAIDGGRIHCKSRAGSDTHTATVD